MSKGLQALVRYSYKPTVDDFNIIQKELKALEIIKERHIDCDCIYDSGGEYIYYCEWYDNLTEEEYDLLKEVLL